MGPNALLQLALFAIGGTLFLLGMAIIVHRAIARAAEARAEMHEARLRPLVLRALADDEFDAAALDAVTGRQRRVLTSLVWHMLTKVRGSSRAALTDWLEATGAIEVQRLRTHSRSRVARAGAAALLGAAGRSATTPELVSLLSDRHEEVRIVAARALGKLGDAAAVGPLLGTIDSKRSVPVSIVSMALLHIGTPAVEPLRQALGSRSAGVRAVAAELLGMHGAMSATKYLRALVEHDRSVEVRVRAVNALGRIGAPSAIETLSRSLSAAETDELRVAAATALGRVGGPHALGVLHDAMNDDAEVVRMASAEALASLDQAGQDVLAAVAASAGPGSHLAADWLSRTRMEKAVRRRRRTVERTS